MGLVVAVCLVIGAIGYVLVGLIGGPQEAGFWLFAGIGGILVYILTFIDLRIGISVMILAIGISPEMSVEGVPNIRIEDFIVPVLAFSWLTRHIAQRDEFKVSLLKGPILAYLGVALVVAMFGLLQGSVQFRETVLVLGKTVVYFLMYLIILNNTRSVQELKAYTILLVLVALVSAVTSLGEARLSDTASASARLQGPYGETANIYAGYLILMLSIIVGLFLFARSLMARFALGIVGLAVFYCMMVTLSRTSYIAFMMAVTIFGLLRVRRLIILSVLVFVLVPLMAPTHVLSRVKTIWTSLTWQQQESFAARVTEWRDSSYRIMDNPFGYGPGSIPLGHVDNEYIRVAVDLGIIGLVVFLWLLFRMGKLAFRNFDAPIKDPTVKGFCAGFCIALFAIMIHAMGATSFSSIRTMESFMVLAGLSSALYANRVEWGLIEEREGEPEDPAEMVLPGKRMHPRSL